MSSIIAVYENSVLAGKNKAGKLKDVGNNYRAMCLGAFDCLSLKGEYYDFNVDIKAMFEGNNRLMDMASSGRLRGEIEHPMPLPGQSMASFMNRVRMIDNSRTAFQIRKLWLEQGKDHNGKPIWLAMGEVTGSGPHMDVWNSRLNNPDENVDASIRCLTHPVYIKNGLPHKAVKLIITWDGVNQGGIEVSNKYDTPSLESINDGNYGIVNASGIPFTEEAFMQADAEAAKLKVVGMETDELIPSTMVKTIFGWEKVELVKGNNAMFW